jgi:hypothetical protein
MQGVAILSLTEVGRQVSASLQASVEIACQTAASDAEVLSLEVSCLGDVCLRDESENYLMNGRSPPSISTPCAQASS